MAGPTIDVAANAGPAMQPARPAATRAGWVQIGLMAALITYAGATAAAEPGVPESLPGPSDERATVTGDRGGQRSVWEENGIAIGLESYVDIMSVVDGGAERGTRWSGLLEPTLALDMDVLAGWPNTRIFLRAVGMHGDDPGELTASLNAPSNLANSVETFRLFEAWIERGFADDALSLRVGIYAVDSEFDVKATAGVFMNGGVGTGIDLSQSGLNGPCTFPTSCFGVRVMLRPTPSTYVAVAVVDGVAGDPEDPRGTHVEFGGDDGALTIGEVGLQRRGGEERFLRAALGAWYYTTTFDDLLDVDAAGDPVRRHGTQGVYALLEGEIYGEPSQPSLSGYLRVGMADQGVNPVRYYVGAGLVGTGLIPGRNEDVAGIAVSVPINGEHFMEARQLAGTPVDHQEVAIECAYRWQVSPWLGLQLDAQYIVNPGTDPSLEDATLFGMRAQFTF